jgi:thiol-disulfide isomerase/thioredoxin
MSFQLFGLSMPLAPWVFVACWFGAQQVAAWTAPRDARVGAAGALGVAGIVGLVAARAAYVIANLDLYLDAPWSMVDVRDGGWMPWAGVAAGLAWLGLAAWRRRAPARALVPAAVLGLALWLGVSAWLASKQVSQLPALTLQRLGSAQGEAFGQAFAGRPFVVNLWATWCAPCREEMPAFAQAQRDRPRVPIVFVNQGEDEARVRAFLAKLPPLDHVWLDRESNLGRAVASSGLPTTVFVDAQGRISRVHLGVMNRAALRAQIDALN